MFLDNMEQICPPMKTLESWSSSGDEESNEEVGFESMTDLKEEIKFGAA
jgi:hypothetical protein